jgi:hypothetical protein
MSERGLDGGLAGLLGRIGLGLLPPQSVPFVGYPLDPPRSELERLQQTAWRAWRNYEILARGDGHTLLEILAEQRGWTQGERDRAAVLWADYAAATYAAARKLAGIGV